MSEGYADTDFEVVDYQMFALDPKGLNSHTRKPLMLRGPRPSLEPNSYFVCLGAAQTFGRFCEKPYPTLLQERLKIEVLNLGWGGAGPSFFIKDNQELLKYINQAKFAIIQVMSGRSQSNSLFTSQGLSALRLVSDGTKISAIEAYKELLQQDKNYVKKIVAETRDNYCQNYQELLQSIKIPKILFWFSTRRPRYWTRYKNTDTLFNEFPQLVNYSVVKKIQQYSDEYVQCISRRGRPHILVSRFTGQPTEIYNKWGANNWTKDYYYPSPQMHIDAANALEFTCRKYI